MQLLLYGALLLSQLGTAAKQYAMKKCGTIAPGPTNSICINMIRSAICLVISLLIWLVTDRSGTTAFGLAIAVTAGIGTACNLFTWILCAQRISLTLLEGVCTLGSLVLPLFLAPYLYGGESISLPQWIGTALIALSLFLFSSKGEKKKEKASAIGSAVLLFVCAIGITVAFVGKKLYTFHVTAKGAGSVELFTLISFVAALAVFAILLPIYRRLQLRRAQGQTSQDTAFPLSRAWHFILIAAVALYVSELFATYASDLPSAIYYPVMKVLNIVGCFILDTLVFHEKVTLKKIIGVIVLLSAVICINI